jgi:thiamine-phosphate diphosphorylase
MSRMDSLPAAENPDQGRGGLRRSQSGRGARAPLGTVHAIVDLGIAQAADVRPRVRAMLAAGLPSLQLRGAAGDRAEHVEVGRWLREETRAAGALFVVNREADLARALEADGVHLRADGPAPAALRDELPQGFRVGASCHDEAEIARARGADWIFLGPVFATESKPGRAPLGLDRFSALCATTDVPVYAIGGVTAERLAACLDAGATGVAAIRACWNDPSHALVRSGRAASRRDRHRERL